MTAWAPLLKKVGEKSCDMAELSGVQGRVGGVMLHEEVGESVELGGRLRHPLKRLDVREDGGSQVIVDLPHAGQLWPDVPIHMTPAHQPRPEVRTKSLICSIRDLPSTICHVESWDPCDAFDRAEVGRPRLRVLMRGQGYMGQEEASSVS